MPSVKYISILAVLFRENNPGSPLHCISNVAIIISMISAKACEMYILSINNK